MNKEETKLVFTYDDDGKYTGTKTLDYTDRSPISGAWQIPAGCTEITAPEPADGMELVWNGEEWKQQPKPEEPEPPEPTEPTAEEKLQIEANSTRANLQTMAINAMMMTLAGNDLTNAKREYQTSLMSISDDVALKIPSVFPTWNGDSIEYKKDMKLTYNDVLYKVLQDHTSQASWAPDAAPSLFAKVLVSDDGTPQEWQQPDSTNPYNKGDRVLFNGKTYESLIDGNVWSPSANPAGWKEVTA